MYKAELQAAINKSLTDFYLEERGNRVTSNNIDGFALKIGIVLAANKIEEKKIDGTGTSK